MYLLLAVLMLLPIVMVLLCLNLPDKANRRTNIVVASFFFVFNAVGLPTYPSAYDKFLIAVGLLLNLLTIWYVWKWSRRPPETE